MKFRIGDLIINYPDCEKVDVPVHNSPISIAEIAAIIQRLAKEEKDMTSFVLSVVKVRS